jgi:agmatinase
VHEPPDALEAPRFTGPRTFARLPLVEELDGVDCAVFGIPWDGGTSYRAGARFGPEAIRSASSLLRPYNPAQRVRVFGNLSLVDRGDAPTVPGYIEDTLERVEAFVGGIVSAGAIPAGIGGDHSATLAELRALAAVRGPLGLIQIDAHGDLWDAYYDRPLGHGTFLRRALEEGLVDGSRTFQAGLRGPLYEEEDLRVADRFGVTQVSCEELAALRPEEFGSRARSVVGDRPAFVTFDVDCVDPAFCPGTGTPEPGGLSAREALGFLRALTGVELAGFDVVEVAPPYDGPGQVTALFAAHVIYELLSLVALRRAG